MKKNELEAVIGNFRHYILLMHEFCNVPVPEEFDPEVQAMTCRDSLVKMAETALANRLMMAALDKEDLAELVDTLEGVNAQAEATLHQDNSTDQTLESE